MDRANFHVQCPVPFLHFCMTGIGKCTGNCALSGFAGNWVFFQCDGEVAVSVDRFAFVTLNGENYQATVRCGTCKLVSKSQKC